jgi:hypothetical protein
MLKQQQRILTVPLAARSHQFFLPAQCLSVFNEAETQTAQFHNKELEVCTFLFYIFHFTFLISNSKN